MAQKILQHIPSQNDVANSNIEANDNTNKDVYLRDGTNTATQNYQAPNRGETSTNQNNNNDANYRNRMNNNYNNIQMQRGKICCMLKPNILFRF